MAKKICPIRQNTCGTIKCMFWEGPDDFETGTCLIANFFRGLKELNFEDLGSLVKLAGKTVSR